MAKGKRVLPTTRFEPPLERTHDRFARANVAVEARQPGVTLRQGGQVSRKRTQLSGAAIPPPDDLKKIKGIGILIEKKLNQMGVYRYAQIAAWTDVMVDCYARRLSFDHGPHGRIRREEWRSQASILAAGNDTEFSRRCNDDAHIKAVVRGAKASADKALEALQAKALKGYIGWGVNQSPRKLTDSAKLTRSIRYGGQKDKN